MRAQRPQQPFGTLMALAGGVDELTMAIRELPVVNRLIAGLPPGERDALLDQCENVELVFGDLLYRQHERYTHAYFPLTAFISLSGSTDGHPPMEIGMVGHEGMLGATLLLDLDLAPHQAVVQGSGTALRIDNSSLQNLLADNPGLLKGLQRYLFRLMAQVSQTTLCTGFHLVEMRLARWLLMSHDRSHSDYLHMTHQYLADMLGVRRSAVTIASGILKKARLIGYSRGIISILDRAGLEAAACGCYSAERFSIPD